MKKLSPLAMGISIGVIFCTLVFVVINYIHPILGTKKQDQIQIQNQNQDKEATNCINSGGDWINDTSDYRYSFCKCADDSEINKPLDEKSFFPKICYNTNQGDRDTCKLSGGNRVK